MAVHVVNEARRCLNCKIPQCRKGCPIQTPIPDMIRLFLDNQLEHAGQMLFENNPSNCPGCSSGTRISTPETC